MQVIKRNGTLVEFDAKKVEIAILKAMKYGSGLVDEHVARDIANEIAALNVDTISIQLIEALVFKTKILWG